MEKNKTKVSLKKGDLVQIVRGNDRGKRGKILSIFPQKGMAIIEGTNMVKRHTRATQSNPQGGIVEKEAPVRISNLRLICSRCNQLTRVRRDRVANSDFRVRICKKCGEIIDKV
ncbi:MAG: large subunit ribosomal protein [Candidatus Atribacteria bacterium]|nr:large subunit ribosomal protein [Candidatus Atribacteria bacterium]